MRARTAAVAFLALAFAATLFANAKITIVNTNAAGVGFNDTMPATPFGGNPGTTLGQQRLNAFQYAADIWSHLIDSPVEIFIRASFEPLTCDATSGTLGSAGPMETRSDFPNASVPGTWYTIALANKLAGHDLSTGTPGVGGDDIRARFNSNVGKPTCLPTLKWYYGLDGNHGSDIDLVVVLLHEFAHGLGFINLVDQSTGELFMGQPDIFSIYTYDDSVGLHWTEMSAAQRKASATNELHLFFDGASVRQGSPAIVTGTTLTAMFDITSPSSLAGSYRGAGAAFGPALSSTELSGTLVQALDAADTNGPTTTDGCSAFTNPSGVAGNIAMVDRGTCNFVVKVKNAQNAGAIGVVIVNDSRPFLGSMGGDDPSITIPSVLIRQRLGSSLKSVLSGNVSVGMKLNAMSARDAQGRTMLYTPFDLEPGSSVSHWDTSAQPNLLMEPAINGDLKHEVDLTENLFTDIGWGSRPSVSAAMRVQVVDDLDGNHGLTRGETLRYTAVVTNDGTASVQNLTFSDTVDTNTTLLAGSATSTSGTVSTSGGTVSVSIPAIAASGSVTITFDALVPAGTPSSVTVIETQGRVTGEGIDEMTDDPSTPAEGDSTRIGFASSAARRRAIGR